MNLHTTPSGNFASLRTQLFVDSLQIQLNVRSADSIMGILRDEKGMICRQLQTTVGENASELSWKGLDDLPYGSTDCPILVVMAQAFNSSNIKLSCRLLRRKKSIQENLPKTSLLNFPFQRTFNPCWPPWWTNLLMSRVGPMK